MATPKVKVLVEVRLNPVEPIIVWCDKSDDTVCDILSVKGVTDARVNNKYGITIMIDPRYDVNEIAEEIESLLLAEVPAVFKK